MNANEELAGTYLQPPMAKVESPFLKFPGETSCHTLISKLGND